MDQGLVVKIRRPMRSYEQEYKAFLFFLPIQAEAGLSIQHQPFEARLCLDLQKSQKCFDFWLSGPCGTSNFDHQSLIHSDLNLTSPHYIMYVLELPEKAC